MTTHGIIYQMVESKIDEAQENEKYWSDQCRSDPADKNAPNEHSGWHTILEHLKLLLPKIQELELVWKKVSEFPPELETWYWCYDTIHGLEFEGKLTSYGWINSHYIGATPTHYMILPKPPTT